MENSMYDIIHSEINGVDYVPMDLSIPSYKIHVADRTARFYKNTNDLDYDEEPKYDTTPIYTTPVDHIDIAEWMYNDTEGYRSLLLKIPNEPCTYIYAADRECYKFVAEAPIVEFVCVRDGVSLFHAVDAAGNIYVFSSSYTDSMILLNHTSLHRKIAKYGSIYKYYSHLTYISNNHKFNDITGIMIGRHEYEVLFSADTDLEFNNLIAEAGGDVMLIQDGNKFPLLREDYIALMDDYCAAKKIKRINRTEIIYQLERD